MILDPVLSAIGLLIAASSSIAASVHVLVRRHAPASTAAWLLAFLFLPLIAPAFYGLVGIDRVSRRAVVKEGRNRALRIDLHHVADDAVEPPMRDGPVEVLPPHLGVFGATLQGLSRHRAAAGHRIDVLDGGDACYAAMANAISAATTSVRLQVYILRADAVGERFVALLADASRRGVRCALLYDTLGSYDIDDTMLAVARRAGVEVSAFAPRHWSRGRYQFNLRNHRKLLVIDGRIAFLGGINFDAAHIGPEPIADVHFRVEGPVVRSLSTVFAEDWYDATGKRLLRAEDYRPGREVGANWARAIPSGPDGDAERGYRVVLAAVHAARDSVLLASPYFLPDRGLEDALVIAARRGVRVEVLVSETLDHPYAGWAMQPLIDPLLAAGVVVRSRPGPLMHAKLVVIDGAWALVGSSNLDPRSFRLNFELSLSVAGPAVGAIEAAWERLAATAPALDLDQRKLRPRWRRAWEGFWSLWSPLL